MKKKQTLFACPRCTLTEPVKVMLSIMDLTRVGCMKHLGGCGAVTAEHKKYKKAVMSWNNQILNTK